MQNFDKFAVDDLKWIETEELNVDQKSQLLTLWNSEYPKAIMHSDIASLDAYFGKLQNLEHTMLLDQNNEIAAWYFDFVRNDENQFAIIISSKYQGKALGKKLIHSAKVKHNKLTAWVVDESNFEKTDGTLYRSPLSFYEKNGFTVLNDRWDSDVLNTVKIRWTK